MLPSIYCKFVLNCQKTVTVLFVVCVCSFLIDHIYQAMLASVSHRHTWTHPGGAVTSLSTVDTMTQLVLDPVSDVNLRTTLK